MKRIYSSIEVLSPQELELIHQTACDILSRMGIHVPGDELLEQCAQLGCPVEWETQLLRIPPQILEDFIQTMRGQSPPPELVAQALHGRISTQVMLVDYKTKQRRYGLRDDNLKGIRLVESLPNIPKANAAVVPSDVPYELSDLICVTDLYKYSHKPGSTYILTPLGAKYIQMADRVMGRRSRYLFETISPLTFKADTVEMALMIAKGGGSLSIAPMAMGMATAPVTVAGTLAVETAECLASAYLVHVMTGEFPSFSMSCHSLDPRSMLCSFGSPNQALFAVAAAQIARFYGIPGDSNSGLTDGMLPDFQAGFEKALSAVMAGFSGMKNIGCQGIVGADQGFSFEQLVIDNEWLDCYNYLVKGFEVTPDTLGFDTIQGVGVAGNYLGEEHTVEHMRDSYWVSQLFGRMDWGNWEAAGHPDLCQRAYAYVESATQGYREMEPVPDAAVCARLDAIADEAYAELKAGKEA